MCKTISHAVYACSYKYKLCFVLKMEQKIQNQYIKEVLSKAFNRKQTTQNFSRNYKKNHKK